MAFKYPCTGVILAGGLNTRFSGKEKAFLKIDGMCILDRVLDTFKAVFHEIILVTNTNAGGAGSLMAAMHASGPRTIVFQSSGVIDMGTASISLEPESRSYVTVAGQTSPGGITLTSSSGTPLNSGYTACRWHDGIFRFIRFRVVRNTGGNGGDHACAFYQAKSFIFDHCDFSGGDDENFDFM